MYPARALIVYLGSSKFNAYALGYGPPSLCFPPPMLFSLPLASRHACKNASATATCPARNAPGNHRLSVVKLRTAESSKGSEKDVDGRANLERIYVLYLLHPRPPRTNALQERGSGFYAAPPPYVCGTVDFTYIIRALICIIHALISTILHYSCTNQHYSELFVH